VESLALQIGSGSLKFEHVEGWEQLPAGWKHADVAGVCTDSDNNVYLYCRGDHPVIIYDRNGNFLDSWGEGQFSYRTHGMFMSGGDQMFLVDDSGNSVSRWTVDGTKLQVIGPEGIPTDSGYDGSDVDSITHGAPPFNRPTNLAVAPSGDLYVSDGYGNCRVHRFTDDGTLIGSWGEPGGGPGEFRLPHSTWVHTDGRVFVADRQNDRIQIFGPTGEYLSEWTDVQRPQDIFIDKDNLVYVGELVYRKGHVSSRRGPIAEEEASRISIYDIEGNLLLRWSDPDPTKAGYFIAPHGIWVDGEGSIYLAEVTDTIGVSRGFAPPDAHTFQKFARV
jgi:DNA-binding beta-propeller fold protein YncE